MKESYELILEKLNKDLKNVKLEINDIIDKVEINEMYKMRYERLVGMRNYCNELISFFEEIIKNL